MEYNKYIQGATLHSDGGVEIGLNGRFVQIAMGEGRKIESSYKPKDARRIASELVKLANIAEARGFYD